VPLSLCALVLGSPRAVLPSKFNANEGPCLTRENRTHRRPVGTGSAAVRSPSRLWQGAASILGPIPAQESVRLEAGVCAGCRNAAGRRQYNCCACYVSRVVSRVVD